MTTLASSVARLPSTTYYRQAGTYTQPQAPSRPDVRDDYERWYTESIPSNRMALSLRSGIHSEVAWSLDRLCRLTHNEQFLLKSIPGLIDALFEWPEWYIYEGYKSFTDELSLFSPPPELARQRRYALESLFTLRNAALNEQNAWELANHSHALPLVLNALHLLQFDRDEHAEFVLSAIDIFHVMASKIVITPTTPLAANPIPPLLRIVSESSNRSMIIASLTALTAVLSNPTNAACISPESPALSAAIKYLPLFIDKPLIDTCLNYLYVHISHSSIAKAFLLHPEMPAVLKLLVSMLLSEQQTLEEKVTLDVSGPVRTIPATTVAARNYELTKEELESLVSKPEPQRCCDWMKLMFIAKPDGAVTQVEFWNLYKDTFTPYADQYALSVAAEVIKNVNSVFPQAQAVVLPGPVQKFVVQGVARRQESVDTERFKCLWDRSQCAVPAFQSLGELYDHILEHLVAAEPSEFPCLWSTCSKAPSPKRALRAHVLTHLSSSRPAEKPLSQSDTITLSSEDSPYPIEKPTERPLPPPRNTFITYERPIVDPPSSALTALLCIRILFRTSFASADTAPRVDADHFGFPGIVEDAEEQGSDFGEAVSRDEQEGERRGRRAFIAVRRLMENVRIRDEVLMGWITEMVDAGLSGSVSS